MQRAARFRSLGDGQVEFAGALSNPARYGYDSWAVLKWERCLKSPDQGSAEDAQFIADRIIDVSEAAFDDFAGGEAGREAIRQLMGLKS